MSIPHSHLPMVSISSRASSQGQHGRLSSHGQCPSSTYFAACASRQPSLGSTRLYLRAYAVNSCMTVWTFRRASFMMVSVCRPAPLGQPTTESGRRYTINGRDKRKAGAVRRAAERVIEGFLAPTSTAILGSQPRQANQVMVLAVSLAGSDMTSHPRKGNPEEQECPSTWQ
jgi:hypothetical protein